MIFLRHSTPGSFTNQPQLIRRLPFTLGSIDDLLFRNKKLSRNT